MKYNKSLLITLGHNSSVIFFNGETKVIGYEEERLSRKKSDSSYPIKALDKVLRLVSDEDLRGSTVFVSHWFDTFDMNAFPEKYFDLGHFNEMIEEFEMSVIMVNPSCTHHDAHAYSAKSFVNNSVINPKMHVIVADGFGNNQEVLSIYRLENNVLTPIHKTYGYQFSLGLFYQYATSFVGMRENQDEYKFLGYESNILQCVDDAQLEKIKYIADSVIEDHGALENSEKPDRRSEDIIDFAKLAVVKNEFHNSFLNVLKYVFQEEFPTCNSDTSRTVIGYFIQRVVEGIIAKLISKYEIRDVALAGGCFLNVKLNKEILELVPGFVSVNPLAGDQGAAIGLFAKYMSMQFPFGDLKFGDRELFKVTPLTTEVYQRKRVIITADERKFANMVQYFLDRDFIVNIMKGSMEFGPRALCNTTTLANPTQENVEYINMVNKRNEVMPMAPVMLRSNAPFLLGPSHRRVVGSLDHMIITQDFIGDVEKNRGVLHPKPDGSGYTCRPQLVDNKSDRVMYSILVKVSSECLINTSFNLHGTPIIDSFQQGIHDFSIQRESDVANRLMLIILNK